MNYLIIYDIKADSEKEYNRIKRKFYYHLKKERFSFLNKSVILVDKSEIVNILSLIKNYKPYIHSYLIKAHSIQEI